MQDLQFCQKFSDKREDAGNSGKVQNEMQLKSGLA